MVDYNKSAQTAERLIRKYGQPGKIRRGGVNHDTVMAVLDFDAKEIDGTHVKVGDRKIYVSALSEIGVAPGDVLVDNAGNPYMVIPPVRSLSPAGINVYYRAQARGLK